MESAQYLDPHTASYYASPGSGSDTSYLDSNMGDVLSENESAILTWMWTFPQVSESLSSEYTNVDDFISGFQGSNTVKGTHGVRDNTNKLSR